MVEQWGLYIGRGRMFDPRSVTKFIRPSNDCVTELKYINKPKLIIATLIFANDMSIN